MFALRLTLEMSLYIACSLKTFTKTFNGDIPFCLSMKSGNVESCIKFAVFVYKEKLPGFMKSVSGGITKAYH